MRRPQLLRNINRIYIPRYKGYQPSSLDDYPSPCPAVGIQGATDRGTLQRYHTSDI